MIEVLALAGAVSQIAGSVSTAIKAGKDVSDLLPSFGKLAKLETEIQLAEKGRHKGPLGRLTSSEEEGFAIAQAKMKHREAMDELRSICHLYGPPNMWNTVIKEQVAARQRHKEMLELQANKRDRIFWLLTVTLGVLIFLGSTGIMLWGVNEAVNG
jgi:hypothetical protein|tara:strand:+ start:404 stop:871 length:468 start_codon:yes stop_codon:yes gene_type:complete